MLCTHLLFIAYGYTNAQCPSSSFTVSSPICIEERLYSENSSTGAESFLWDYCDGALVEPPSFVGTGQSLMTGFHIGMKLIEDNDGMWYGFLLDYSGSNKITRIDFGPSLGGIPLSVTPLTLSPSNLINGPEGIEFVNEGGVWYGLVTNYNSSTLAILDFGSSLSKNDPTVSQVVINLSGALQNPQGIAIAEESGVIYAIIPNAGSSSAVMLEFTSGITNPADGAFIDVGSGGFFAEFARECDQWYAYVSTNNRVKHLAFGSDLNTSPTVDDLVLDQTVRQTGGISVFYSMGSYYMITSSAINGNVYRINLGSDLSSKTGTVEDFGIPAGYTGLWAIDGIKFNSDFHFYAVDEQVHEVQKISFANICGDNDGNYLFNGNANLDITYPSDDTYTILLAAYDANGNVDYHNESVVISPQTAPPISFGVDASRCITNMNTFTPSNTGLTSYNWDFDGDDIVDVVDGTGSDQTFDYSGLGTGTYTVRLDVSDGTCNNFYVQDITIYDPPPAPAFSYSSPRTCINTNFTFTNETIDAGYMGPLEYLWEFIDEPSGIVVATANTRDAVYAFETEGQKTVRLTSSIPGCQEITEQTLMITPGPTANFFAVSVCQNEAMEFTNTSSDAISYSWDFGDGFMSTATNPSHIFNGAGNFNVTLTATDAEGCTDQETIEVAVSDSPQIDFDFDIPCTSSDGIQFFDLTTVDNADLVSWTWFVDDVQVSTLQSPMITFSSTGLKNVRLDVQSSNGCESSSSQNIEVLSAPTADFTINLGCQGEISTFNDNTTSTGNPVVSWFWTVDGVNYGTQDINHVFTDAGTYDVTLEVTGQNFCPETITKSIEIIALPEVNFAVNGECDNQLISALDQSIESSDPIVARRWMLDGANVGNGSQLVLPSLADDTYELSLELETQAGCIINASQTLEINDAPESSFTSSRTYGLPNDQIVFTNTSSGGISYEWLLDGEVRSSDPQSEAITFANPGTYNVSLVSQNSLGCNDTSTQEILIAVPEVDLAIGSFELVSENNVGRIFLEVQNFSNLPVELTEAQIVLENTFTVTEQILEFIDVGASSLVSLNVGIPLTVSEPAYFCVSLSSQYVNYPDIQPVNNEKCLTIEPVTRLEDPFPNPVTDQFRLKLVVSQESTANISLINSAGKVEIVNVQSVTEGLNNFFIDMSILNPGIYYVVVDVNGTTHKKKVIKL